MVVVAGMWELGWNTPIKEIDLWRYPLKDFGVDRFYMTPISGIESKKVIELFSAGIILYDRIIQKWQQQSQHY
jgi:hypothetical protein